MCLLFSNYTMYNDMRYSKQLCLFGQVCSKRRRPYDSLRSVWEGTWHVPSGGGSPRAFDKRPAFRRHAQGKQSPNEGSLLSKKPPMPVGQKSKPTAGFLFGMEWDVATLQFGLL